LKPQTIERFAFTLKMPVDTPAIRDEAIAQQCQDLGIQRWQSSFQLDHDENGKEIYLATVLETVSL
jgi:molybdopterin-guanine dinucleotide biosynthesis protein A